MASIKVSTLLLTYAFIAVFLHPFLCPGSMTKMMTATNEAGVATSDGKMIDQGIAYLLMMVVLLVTYLLH
ncbi:hypothetical protein ZIOFF_041653 [Zingiber officinale]|uniref:Uncharacterized protein n=1 Tax=Zingiber officinale TaxID=94328 RepID=A0A8J5GE66_ZINOF|nr:hypothetical protein ZIOFF_041653 [Zingiber officinale]